MSEYGPSTLPSFYPTSPSQFPINPTAMQPTPPINNCPTYPSSTLASYPQHASYTSSKDYNALVKEHQFTPITSNLQFPQPIEIPYNIANPTSAIQNPNPMTNQGTLTSFTPCQTINTKQHTLNNLPSIQTSLLSPSIDQSPFSPFKSRIDETIKKVFGEERNTFFGVPVLFDESTYTITMTKYRFLIESYLPGDFFPIFKETQDQEEDKKLIFFGSLEHGVCIDCDVNKEKSETKSLPSCHPDESSKGVVFVTSLSDVLLEFNAKLGDLNSLLVVGQSRPIHHISTTVSHSFARMRNKVSTDLVVYVLPPLLLGDQRRTHLGLGDACVTKDKYADFVDTLKQGGYNDPFVTATNELFPAKLILLLRKGLLQGMHVGTTFSSGCLIRLLKASCYKGRCKGCLSCVVPSWDPGGSNCAMYASEDWRDAIEYSNFEGNIIET